MLYLTKRKLNYKGGAILDIDMELILKILPVGISLLSLFYTRKIDKREEKRYAGAVKDKLRYEALLISKEFSYILNRYGWEYNLIEYWVKENKKFTKIDSSTKFNKKDLLTILNSEEDSILGEELNIYDYKEIVKEFTKDEIDYIDKLFQLKTSIEKLKKEISLKYKLLDSDGGFINTDNPDMKAYFDSFNAIQITYKVLFYMICDTQSEDFKRIFKKIDDLSNIKKEKVVSSLVSDYEDVKNNYLNLEEYLENIKNRMEEYFE